MLDSLRDGLQATIKRLVNSSGVDEEQIEALAKDVQRALLVADVNAKMVFDVTARIKKRAKEETPPPGLSRKDHIVKILYTEMAALLGGDPDFEFRRDGTNKILMLGIQGSGKTTMTAKLARFLKGQGYKVGVIGADTYRPGALAQLRTMCDKTGVEVYGDEKSDDPARTVKEGLGHFGNSAQDIIIIDTAGRHKEESDLLDEMKSIGSVAEPDLALLVIDGTIGKKCQEQAAAFHRTVPVGGIVISKLDSSARGGGALAAAAATGARIMYVGTGERIDDIERFSATRFVGRLLGMGDIQAILDMARRLENESDEVRLKRITSGRINMDDFYYQLSEVTKSSGLQGMLNSLPGVAGNMTADKMEKTEERIKRWRYIIQSMTAGEKDDPALINQSRRKRIARGAGCTEYDVKELLKGYKNSKTMIKASKGRNMRGALKRMGLG